MEHDMYGAQKKIWGTIRRRKQETNEFIQTTTFTEQKWTKYFQK